MTEPTPPGEPGDADARIGAWLDGELSEAEAEAFVAELAEDAELASRVEAIRAVRERLAGAPATTAPPGFRERVAAAIAAEDHPGAASAATASLAAARARRQQRRRRLVAAGSVAAALVAVAVIVPTVGGLLDPSPESVTNSAEVAQDDTGHGDDAAGEAGGRQELDSAGAASPEDRAAADTTAADDLDPGAPRDATRDVPVIVEQPRTFDRVGALIDHLTDRPEATELMGLGSEEATRLAERTASELRRAQGFADGTPADACADESAAATHGPAVFARVQPVRLDGASLIAHLVVTGPPGEPLDRVVVQVRDPAADCRVEVTQRLARATRATSPQSRE